MSDPYPTLQNPTEPGVITDPCRPVYHYSSGGWMNDVIPVHDGEALHVFFNHNPAAAKWGRFCWGHARTTDLARWEASPIALSPTPGGPDSLGIWTGCVVPVPDGFAALYTGVTSIDPLVQNQCLALSSDAEAWDKRPGAVITAAPPGYGDCFRDPFVRREGDAWRMLLGSTRRDGEVAAVLAYDSPDLVDWAFAGPLHVAGAGDLGHHAECPELFRLGDRDVLVASCEVTRGVVGSLDGAGAFVPDGPAQAFDPAASYAARSTDVGGRRIQLAWLRDTRSRREGRAAGWLGALSLPRVIGLGHDGALTVAPAPELAALRAAKAHDGPVPLRAGRTVVPGVRGLELELDVELEGRAPGRAGLVVGCDPAGEGGLAIEVDRDAGLVAGHDLGPLDRDRPLRLHVFVDRSVVEVFALGRVVTLRHYDLPDEPRVALWSQDGPASAHLTAWHLAVPPPP